MAMRKEQKEIEYLPRQERKDLCCLGKGEW
jgi:hypothetical protein